MTPFQKRTVESRDTCSYTNQVQRWLSPFATRPAAKTDGDLKNIVLCIYILGYSFFFDETRLMWFMMDRIYCFHTKVSFCWPNGEPVIIMSMQHFLSCFLCVLYIFWCILWCIIWYITGGDINTTYSSAFSEHFRQRYFVGAQLLRCLCVRARASVPEFVSRRGNAVPSLLARKSIELITHWCRRLIMNSKIIDSII